MKALALQLVLLGLGLAPIASCVTPQEEGADLAVGELSEEDGKDDGAWGYALTCKTIPSVTPLRQPRITVSIDGLTLHLTDAATGYDRVFPVGVGAISHTASDPEYGESHTYYPILRTGQNDFTLRPSQATACKTWWTDPDTRKRMPVFGGLPFMPFYGNYAIHGPIDDYRNAAGGTLRRGYVSHGCVRMAAADVVEVYGRLRGVASVPVHLQKEPERSSAGVRVDVAAAWVGTECTDDSRCAYTGGRCRIAQGATRGFCTLGCTGTCPDQTGWPMTFCATDPAATTRGVCVPRETAVNEGCRPYDGILGRATLARFGQGSVRAGVCAPPQ